MQKHLILTALLAVLAAPAQASTYLTVAGLSWHSDRAAGYREKNPGIGIEHDVSDDVSLIAGTYINSYNRRTAYAGARWMPLVFGPVRAGLTGAVATGYEQRFVAFPTLTVDLTDRVGLGVIAAPGIGKDASAFVGVELRLRFN